MEKDHKDVTEESNSAGNGEPPAGQADRERNPKEIGGRGGLDPTRYGDWEKNGRCIDF